MPILFIAQSCAQSPGIRRRSKCNPVPFVDADFFFSFHTQSQAKRLDEAELSGGNVESIDISGEAGESLLGAVRAATMVNISASSDNSYASWHSPDQGVDLDGVNVIELLQGLLDLGLVGLDIDDEDEGVLLLNLLEGTLGVEGVDDDLVLIEAGLVRDRLARVLGGTREDEGLGAVEGGRVADLGLLLRVHLEGCQRSDAACLSR